jgi:hypothetical protein
MDSDPTLFEISAPKGDHLEPPPSSHPIKTPSYELRPALIALVRENSFLGTKEESPYIHLQGFEQVCSIIVIEGMNHQTLKWKLFPFSLVGGAKKWYYSSVGSMEGSWDKLREKFCLTFFPMSQVVTQRLEILSLKQLDKESLGIAWARFANSLAFGPDIGIPEPILLQHLGMGLDDESAKFLDTSSVGSFSHLTLSEGKDILGKILENTPYMGIFEEFPDEEEEPMPNTLSEPKPIEEEHTFRTIQSIKDFTPLTKTWFTDEPFQPYMEVDDPSCDFVYEFYDEIFDKH